ncbi:iron-sulfur cluster assembly accessory protein [Niveibacterium sp. SC-1]|uniref:HesB/IscA family protein n=1 Tax=Niveibacterium sp. SC-1 TaxID=3135646 RepID=UPI00311F7F09
MTQLTLTPAATRFIGRMLRFSGQPADAGFRLDVTPGGCSGLNAAFTVEAKPGAGESVLDVAGVRLFLTAGSRLLLEGATVDFADTPTQSGLTFVLPNQTPCGCSSSGADAHGHGHAGAPAPGVATVAISAIKRH